MAKVMQTTVIEIEGMLAELRDKHNAWQLHQKQSDDMLHALLEGSLEFYRLLKTDEDCLVAFKELVSFKWSKKTKLSTMVVKAIFGAAKKGYAYARALEAAFTADIGREGQVSMSHWLNDNGGLNGVIRTSKGKSRVALEREHAINVARNPQAYGHNHKPVAVTSTYFEGGALSYDFAVLCRYDAATRQTLIIWGSESKQLLDDLYADFGNVIMQQPVYKQNRVKAHKQQSAKKAAATTKIKTQISAIKASVASAEKEAKAA